MSLDFHVYIIINNISRTLSGTHGLGVSFFGGQVLYIAFKGEYVSSEYIGRDTSSSSLFPFVNPSTASLKF